MTSNHDSSSDTNRPPPSLAKAVVACFARFEARLLDLFETYYDKIEGVLLEAADKAESNSLHASYVLATQQFRRHRSASRAAFHRELQKARVWPFEAAADAQMPGFRDSPLDAPAVAAQVEFEERLAIENLISKSSSRYRDALLALNEALSRSLGGPTLPLAAHPIGPPVVCKALLASLQAIAEVDRPVRLVLYKLFDKQVMDRLEDVYAACARDIAASIDEAGAPRRAAANGRRSSCTTRGGAPRAASPDRARAVSFAMLRRALAQGRSPGRGGESSGVTIDELLGVLSGIQHTPAAQAVPAAELRVRLGRALGRSLGAVDETTLELVFLLFEHLLADNMLPDAIKVLISRLQIPILKTALLDKAFFDDPEHPARNLLNHMAQAAMGWTDDGDRAPDSLYGRLERIVERVIGDFGEDLTLFAELDRELCATLAAEDDPARTRETRACELAEQRAQASTIAQIVEATIQGRLQGYRRVPPAVAELLQSGWVEVLATTYGLEGPESTAWHEKVALMDQLLSSICPKTTKEERRELLQGIPTLVRQLRLGFSDTMLDPRKVARWLRELQVLHLTALRGEGSTEAVAETAVPSGVVATRPETVARAVVPAAPEALSLAAGTWIALHRDDADPVRLKLIWRARDASRHLFIDGPARRTVELDGKRLTRMVGDGTVEIIGHERDAIVDRAVAAVMASMEN